MNGARIKYCKVCNKNIHRSSLANQLKSKLHNQNEKINPSNFFIESIQQQQAKHELSQH